MSELSPDAPHSSQAPDTVALEVAPNDPNEIPGPPGDVVKLSSLCKDCQTLFGNLVHEDTEQTYDQEYDLENSISLGCRLCKSFWGNRYTPERTYKRTLFPAILHGNWRVQLPNNGDYKLPTVVALVREQNLWSSTHNILAAMDSEENFVLVKRWLDTCVKTHSCSVSPTACKLPTRLLYLDPSNDQVRLIITDTDSEIAEYLTLSHCWGSASASDMPKLQKHNIQQLMQQIPFKWLSETFQDSILVTKRLGFRYLWIDALCIIQDSLDDWLRESITMCDVYRGSTLNIAATASKDGHGGCFRSRAPGRQPKLLRLEIGESIFDLFEQYTWDNEVERAPLSQRGWVLQERLLAPRTLHFGDTQIFWECRELHACEIQPHGSEALYRSDPYLLVASLIKGGFSDIDFWENTVKRYSQTSLTKESDKLPAISGIAKLVQSHTNDRYLCGLWRKDIEKQLLWHIAGHNKADTYRPHIYRAPSWSWASLNGPTVFYYCRAVKCIKFAVTDVSIVPSGLDEFSGIEFGSLRVRCESLRICQNVGLMNDDRYDFDTILTSLKLTLYLLAAGEAYGDLVYLILQTVDQAKGNYQRIGIFRELIRTPYVQEHSAVLDESAYESIDRSKGEGLEEYFIILV
ncbi:hypothetical protein HYFRA_00005865 [Hymenoscyphus fraxineus]|uniref:Heterokaryon incompatibility domain-containing protein n=1 Tax=Hymenoscyphus fraxineus TaxID=746836 RepID=A0A9N9PSK0_9HELO|nr:hypothetical protein HYFRA_00005865 [Hymenoscyphus fraxineus]